MFRRNRDIKWLQFYSIPSLTRNYGGPEHPNVLHCLFLLVDLSEENCACAKWQLSGSNWDPYWFLEIQIHLENGSKLLKTKWLQLHFNSTLWFMYLCAMCNILLVCYWIKPNSAHLTFKFSSACYLLPSLRPDPTQPNLTRQTGSAPARWRARQAE